VQWSLHLAKKIKKIKIGFVECQVFGTRQRDLKKTKFFAECQSFGTRQRFFFKKNKKTCFAECPGYDTRQRVFFKKNKNSLPSVALGKGKIYIKKQNGVTCRPTASNLCRVTARHSAKPLSNARDLALGKAGFTVKGFDGASLPSVALGKGFDECNVAFAEYNRHSANRAAVFV
jgi:hypothetical protein